MAPSRLTQEVSGSPNSIDEQKIPGTCDRRYPRLSTLLSLRKGCIVITPLAPCPDEDQVALSQINTGIKFACMSGMTRGDSHCCPRNYLQYYKFLYISLGIWSGHSFLPHTKLRSMRSLHDCSRQVLLVSHKWGCLASVCLVLKYPRTFTQNSGPTGTSSPTQIVKDIPARLVSVKRMFSMSFRRKRQRMSINRADNRHSKAVYISLKDTSSAVHLCPRQTTRKRNHQLHNPWDVPPTSSRRTG